METFCAEYRKQLEIAVKERADEFFWHPGVPLLEQVPEVFERMKAAIARGTFNKDGRAFKQTCKVLGIKHTYKAIAEFIASHK